MTATHAIDVRTATPDELPQISSILEEAHAWLVSRNLPLWSPGDLTEAALRPAVEAGHYLLAFAGAAAAGTARLTRDDLLFWPDAVGVKATYLHRLAVRRAHAGGAVSGALVNASLERARAAGSEFLRLDCRADIPRLRGLYEGFGFTFESERRVNGNLSARFQKRVRAA